MKMMNQNDGMGRGSSRCRVVGWAVSRYSSWKASSAPLEWKKVKTILWNAVVVDAHPKKTFRNKIQSGDKKINSIKKGKVIYMIDYKGYLD